VLSVFARKVAASAALDLGYFRRRCPRFRRLVAQVLLIRQYFVPGDGPQSLETALCESRLFSSFLSACEKAIDFGSEGPKFSPLTVESDRSLLRVHDEHRRLRSELSLHRAG